MGDEDQVVEEISESDAERARGRFIQVDSNGRIVASIDTQEVAAATMIDGGDLPPGHYLVAVDGNAELEWYDGTDVVPRPENPAHQVGNRIVGVPAGSYVWFDGTRHLVDDSVVDLAGSQPGRYRVRIESFPQVDGVLEIEITA